MTVIWQWGKFYVSHLDTEILYSKLRRRIECFTMESTFFSECVESYQHEMKTENLKQCFLWGWIWMLFCEIIIISFY